MTIFVERAFGQSWKNFNEGIGSIFWIGICPSNDFRTIGKENTTKKNVEKIHLSNHVDEVQKVTNEVNSSVAAIHALGLHNIFDQCFTCRPSVLQF